MKIFTYSEMLAIWSSAKKYNVRHCAQLVAVGFDILSITESMGKFTASLCLLAYYSVSIYRDNRHCPHKQ